MATEGDTVKTLIIAAIIITVLFALAGKAVQTEIANQTAKATATAAIMGK
jgi:Tfp pilus assembly major pilin PilA